LGDRHFFHRLDGGGDVGLARSAIDDQPRNHTGGRTGASLDPIDVHRHGTAQQRFDQRLGNSNHWLSLLIALAQLLERAIELRCALGQEGLHLGGG